MTQYVQLSLSDSEFQRVKEWAKARDQEVNDAIIAHLENTVLSDNEQPMFISEPDPDLEREKEAYLNMHPELLEKYPSQHVAIYQGQLIDHDEDEEALFERIDDLYPDAFVWIAKITEEPIPIYTYRTLRLVD